MSKKFMKALVITLIVVSVFTTTALAANDSQSPSICEGGNMVIFPITLLIPMNITNAAPVTVSTNDEVSVPVSIPVSVSTNDDVRVTVDGASISLPVSIGSNNGDALPATISDTDTDNKLTFTWKNLYNYLKENKLLKTKAGKLLLQKILAGQL